MSDPFPLVSRRSPHVKPLDKHPPHVPGPLADMLAKKGIGSRPPLTAGWPPADWEGDDFPCDDSDAAIRQWFDYFIGLLPAWESAWRDMSKDGTGAAGRVVRDAYRLLRHLRDHGRTQAQEDEKPATTYTMHDALLILRRLRDALFPAPATLANTPSGPRPRMTVEEANRKATDLAKRLKKKFFTLSEREQAKRIGCSWATWKKTTFYQAAKKKLPPRKKGSRKGAVSLTDTLQAATGEGGRDEVLNQLIAEQEADGEPSPIDPRPRKVQSRKRL
jgi:hypothetical protein